MPHLKILSLSLLSSVLVLAGCTAQTTTESASGGNTNVVTNTNATNDNANVEVVTNTNETVGNENTNDASVNSNVDTSDLALSEVEGWLTYTNEEYGFSFKHPNDWSVNKYNTNYLTVLTENITDLPIEERPAPTSSASPVTQSQNKTEQLNLQAAEESSYNGKLVETPDANFYRYNAVVENKSFVTEYVTYIDDVKITLRYLEDSSDQKESSDVLDTTLLNIVQTFQD